MVNQNRVEADQEALWSRHLKEIARDPELQNQRPYWKELSKQYAAIIEKYKDNQNLSPAEKSSLAVAKISHKNFQAKGDPKYVQRASRSLLKGITGDGKKLGDYLLKGVNGSMRDTANRMPWYFAVPAHGVRVLVGLAANVLNFALRQVDFVIDMALPKVPSLKTNPMNRNPNSKGQSAGFGQTRNDLVRDNQLKGNSVDNNAVSKGWNRNNNEDQQSNRPPKDNPLSAGQATAPEAANKQQPSLGISRPQSPLNTGIGPVSGNGQGGIAALR